ncbi:monovalent cation/H+ antiporter subunit A [Sinomonas cyclohexanicum]|uniref:Monovalent cation/H+ antiporter subunit A n=1 Tax=Sinomonas cyclohexanicum TaxID=322009 RepID=A0ABM7PZJ7_SINCY|nr:Na+/H+ antiporter subunit A [Corynebacterium cyclohexanicum]BCT77737.1 monovalent cation/H+ antiporter subunit A [Corynebacterium cyclohexanicum]
MLPVLALHFVVAAGAPWIFRWMGRSAFFLLAAVPAGSLVWLAFQHNAAYDAGPVASAATAAAANGPPQAARGIVEAWDFIPTLGVQIAFRLDPLAWVLCLLVLGVGALVLLYCARYFKGDDEGLGGFGGQMLAFAGAMFGLVTADDLIVLFIFWELTTVLSYLLIGYANVRLSARRSALQALIVTTAGGLAMLVGLILLGEAAGTYRVSGVLERAPALVADPATAGVVAAGAVLVLVGALSKSALVPFHFWLPAAMAAPTPVSAYLHAAAMVKAGVYLVARLAPGFAETDYWQPVVLGLGLATMLLGGYRSLRQIDIKLILAFGTVSQLGFMIAIVGLGTPAAALAGLAMVVAHALFKAALFLVVGIIDHQTGTRDLRRLSGVYRQSRALAVTAALAAASMAGLPLFGGFVAKESVFDAFAHAPLPPGLIALMLAGFAVGSALTVAYSVRFVWGAFARKRGVADTPFTPITPLFVASPAILAVLGLAYGVWPAPVDSWVGPYATEVAAGAAAATHDGAAQLSAVPHLAAWHGVGLALVLSAAGWAVGALLFWARVWVTRLQARLASPFDAERGYRAIVGAVDDVAIWVTGRTQRGSLFFYLAVILAVAALVPLSALLAGRVMLPGPERLTFVDPGSPLVPVISVAIAIGAIAAVRANKRFLAVLMVSITGYGISLIFALQGAPDLAVTQMLVETIVLVAFVLGMRSLPPQLRDRTGGKYRAVRIVIAVVFGTVMVLAGLAAMDARIAAPVSLQFPELAYTGGGGLNIVNVTLVDIRAWDTFGEISVLALAATGVASLIFIRHSGRTLGQAADVPTGSIGRMRGVKASRGAAELSVARTFATIARDPWLVAGRTLAPERRSIIFEVITRLIFHSMVVFSVYVLLAGHNLPGGGFAGGLLAGLALTVRYLAGGRFELREAASLSPGVLLGVGLGTAALSGAVPLALGGQVFQSAIIELWLPVFGDVKFVTSTIFDIGVYLVVVGLVVDVLRSLGSRIDEHLETGERVAAGAARRPRGDHEEASA